MYTLPLLRPTWKSTTSGKVENIIKNDINHDAYRHGVGSWSIYDDVALTTSTKVELLNNHDNLSVMPKMSTS